MHLSVSHSVCLQSVNQSVCVVCVCVSVCLSVCPSVCVMTFGAALLYIGSGVEPDMKKSAELFTDLALKGHPYAQV